MSEFHRLEDVLPAWRARIGPALQTQLDSALRTPGRAGLRAGQSTPAGEPGRGWYEPFVPECLTWLMAEGYWPNKTADRDQVQAELRTAIAHLPAPSLPPEMEERMEVPASAWALPAAIGAAVGALVLSPLTWVALENRPVGLWVGGVLGAYTLVRSLASLAARPRLQAILRTVAGTAGIGMVGAGIWRVVRGQTTGWFRASLYLAAVWLVLGAVRPRGAPPSSEEALAHRRRRLDHLLRSAADLVLALAWAHPERGAPLKSPDPVVREWINGSIVAALSDLYTALHERERADDLWDLLEAFFQRFEEAGFEWRLISRGRTYEDSMRAEFDSYGLIAPGQAVRMSCAALRHHGTVVHRGEVRKV
ncbi:MAG: hypothetical protein JWO38_2738 [Gemmataceae bacterium]|nr:hypothetical protein [Gemmataceae bacterium]